MEIIYINFEKLQCFMHNINPVKCSGNVYRYTNMYYKNHHHQPAVAVVAVAAKGMDSVLHAY
jgi:hypothetical protein